MSKKVTNVVMVVIFLLAANAPVYPEGNLHIGTMEIHPFASVEQKYDDNIFLEPKGSEDGDLITIATLGFDVKKPLVVGREDDFMLEGGYRAEVVNFWDSTESSRVDHMAHVLTDLNFANDFGLKISEQYEKTADPPNSERTALQKRYRNLIRVLLSYEGKETGFDVGYENVRDGYNNLTNLDRYESIVSMTGSYQIFPKTSIFGEFDYGLIDYDIQTTNSDSSYRQWMAGLRGEIAPKLTGTVKTGYRSSDYEQRSKSDFQGLTFYGDLLYDIQERTQLLFTFQGGPVESSYGSNSFYKNNTVGFILSHELRPKLSMEFEASYEHNKYPDATTEGTITSKRKDHIYKAGLDFTYEMKDGIQIAVGYEYKQRASGFSNYDYKDNRVRTKVSFLF